MSDANDTYDLSVTDINDHLNDAHFEAVTLENAVGNIIAFLGQQNGTGEHLTEDEADELESYIDEAVDAADAVRDFVGLIIQAVRDRDEAAEELAAEAWKEHLEALS